jgi:hypothetical protein
MTCTRGWLALRLDAPADVVYLTGYAIRTALHRESVSYTPPLMDAPLRPEEQLVDAIRSLTLTLEKMLEMLEVLACELVLAGGPPPPFDHPVK